MENRLDRAFQQDRSRRVIPFIEAGDPDFNTSLDLVKLLDGEGVSAIELGVPYSDPLADGPVIQAASERALAEGMTLPKVLQLADAARAEGVRAPLVLFSYYNPILRFGPARLVQQAEAAGIDGMIVPDLPWEESEELSRFAGERGLHLVPLVAPTSRERIRQIASRAKGFVYCVSSLGTTGVRSAFADGVEAFLDTVKQHSPVPIAVGFGISRREHVDRFMAHADAAVVGSALVRQVEERREELQDPSKRRAALDGLRLFIRDLIGEKQD
ncbi:tryptophan synthase subunit alpha [Paludifilum halophilum]|uniref:Tryptophan synthase alpha chain n=1 Tax=Paludifilum halophilum TaxID=1642702 RepID=A0A235BBP2_9BACL|nr:tryptophan synthase subunit alpha [Paludifilum halophilum]OYD09711.1 tryptophan synthase subunit alpha [Paludifilum halophilum]